VSDYFIFKHQRARELAAERCMTAPDDWVCRFGEPVKSREQEEKYHAIIGEIADTELLYGKKVDKEVWKRVLIAAFKYDTDTEEFPELRALWATFGSAAMVPMLGNRPGFVMVGEQSRRFPKRLAMAFITWLQAFQDGAE